MTDRNDHDGDDDRLDLAAWAAPPPPAGLADRVLARVHERPVAALDADALADAPHRGRRLALFGGAVIAAAGLTFALWPAAPRATRGQVTASAPSSIALADGVDALLETGAQLAWKTDGDVVRVAHDAGVVTYRHRGDRRLEVATSLGVLASERASFRVEAPMKRELIWAGAGALAAGAIVIAVYEGRVQASQPDQTPAMIAAGNQHTLAAPSTPSTPVVTAVARATVDRARRAELAAAIAAVRRNPRPAGVAAGSATASPPPATAGTVGTAPVDATPGVLTKEEIRAGVKDVAPMLADCFELELANRPTLRGRVVAKMIVDSEPDLGAVVSVGGLEIDGELGASTDFRDCVGATLEAVVLPPLADGGHVEITYPFVFAPADDGADGAGAPAATSPPPVRPPKPRMPPADATVTPEKLVENAGLATMNGQFARALSLAERALARPDLTAPVRSKANTIAVLAACQSKNEAKARRYFKDASPTTKSVLRQRCLQTAKFDPGP